jgi:D-beta-D-heptose 7-phosphate kinase/D-beta-D-heptose 1-phosphate adenosyltransferase
MFQILIIGDVMLDQYLIGSCSRISPEAPVPVVNIKSEEWRLGGAANVANSLFALQTNCTLVGTYGDDGNARHFDAILAQHQQYITNGLCTSSTRPTTVKTRVLVGSHQMLRVDREKTAVLNEEEETMLTQRFLNHVENADLILVSDYSKGVLSPKLLQTIFAAARELNKPTIVDPKSQNFSIYKGADFIKPNRKEAELATGLKITDRSSLEAASKMIRNITGVEAVITTLSEDGVAIYENDKLHLIPTRAQQVFDVTGAGDTYLAAFAYEYLHTADIIAACEFANAAAAVVISKIGSSTATLEEIHHLRKGVPIYESTAY